MWRISQDFTVDALEYIAEDDLEIALELEQHDVK